MSECWHSVKVKELGIVVTGKTPPTKDKHNFGKGYPFIKPPDLSENTRTIKETENEITEDGLSTLPDKLIPPKSTCVVCIGSIGKKIGFTSLPSVTNQQINSIVVNQSSYDPYFVYYLLRTALPQVKQLDAGSASGRENVNKSTFENIEVCVPSIALQRKIASILSPYDDLIENNTLRIKILEEMIQTIYNEWFVKFRFPGYENVKTVNSELGMIPEGWRIANLSNMVNFIRGVEPGSKKYLYKPDNTTVPFYRVGDLGTRNSNIFIMKKHSKQKFTTEEDILISLDGTVGRVVMGLVGCYSTGIRKVDIEDKANLGTAFVYCLLKSERIQEIINSHAKGTTIKHANTSIDYMSFVLPPSYLVKKFEIQFLPLLKSNLKLSQKIRKLQVTRDLLITKLISGEIDVSELDIDLGGITA